MQVLHPRIAEVQQKLVASAMGLIDWRLSGTIGIRGLTFFPKSSKGALTIVAHEELTVFDRHEMSPKA